MKTLDIAAITSFVAIGWGLPIVAILMRWV
jgi:hypothetical protein